MGIWTYFRKYKLCAPGWHARRGFFFRQKSSNFQITCPQGLFFRQKSSNFQIACPQGLFFRQKSSDFQIACPQGLFFLQKSSDFQLACPQGLFSSQNNKGAQNSQHGVPFSEKMCRICDTVITFWASKNSEADPLRSAGNGVRPGRTDPGYPTPGSRMTVVYTNSLK